MLIVGERINATSKRIAQAIKDKDATLLSQEAVAQVEAGADFIEVNAAPFLTEEADYLQWLIAVLQEVIEKPLCIDTPNLDVAIEAMKSCQRVGMINSITGDVESYRSFLPVLKEFGWKVIALCQDKRGIPKTTATRVEIASRIVEDLTGQGIDLGNIYIDPLIQPIGIDNQAAVIALDTIQTVMNRYPGIHTICGLSNISFGLPSRSRLNRNFVVLAQQGGLDSAIINPLDRELMADIVATNTLLGKDQYCGSYLRAYRKGKL